MIEQIFLSDCRQCLNICKYCKEPESRFFLNSYSALCVAVRLCLNFSHHLNATQYDKNFDLNSLVLKSCPWY